MSVISTEVVKTNLVLAGTRLLTTQDEFEAFRVAVGVDVQVAGTGLATSIPSGVAEPVLGLTLNRDRIAIELSPARSTFSRDYPLRHELPRLAEVSCKAINNTNLEEQRIQGYGFNIELVFDQDSGDTAFEYLAKRLFGTEPLGNEGWRLIGGAGRLIFGESRRRWSISLEPRFNSETESRVFLNANLHISETALPKEVEIQASLEEIWDNVHRFVGQLDTAGSRDA